MSFIVTRKKHPIHHAFSFKGVPLKVVDEASYLDGIVSKDLAWHKRTKLQKVTKPWSLWRAKWTSRRHSETLTKENSFGALVLPTVEYASTVWSPHPEELWHDIKMVQRRAARYVMARYGAKDSVTALLQELSWDTLEQQRVKSTQQYGVPHHTSFGDDTSWSIKTERRMIGIHQRSWHSSS